MIRPRAWLASIGVACAALVACDGAKVQNDGGAKDAEVVFEAAAPPMTPDASLAAQARPPASSHDDGDASRRDCRVMSSEGGPSASADPATWLDVPAKASFSVRTFDTGRELRFEGPGRMRPCGGEVALVAEGSAGGLPGSGEAPGSGQWVATACGAARWASGVHRIVGGKDACRVQTSAGMLQLYVAEDVSVSEVVDGGAPEGGVPDAGAAALEASTTAGFRQIARRSAFVLTGRSPLTGPAAVKTALTACERAAAAVADLATRMNGGDAAALGALAGESVGARGTARAACAVAEVRITMAGGHEGERARLAAAVARFRTAP